MLTVSRRTSPEAAGTDWISNDGVHVLPWHKTLATLGAEDVEDFDDADDAEDVDDSEMEARVEVTRKCGGPR